MVDKAEHRAFVELVTKLQKLGATHVRAGELEVSLAPARSAPIPRKAETAKERAKREAEEYERDLMWSAP